MSEKRNDGGPAFPTERELPDGGGLSLMEGGMTLRDYFAASAVRGLCTWIGGVIDPRDWDHARIAEAAGKVADAMLAERDR